MARRLRLVVSGLALMLVLAACGGGGQALRPSPSPSASAATSPSPSPAATPETTPAPTPAPTPEPTPEETPTAAPTAAPTAEPTQTPTPTPAQAELPASLRGVEWNRLPTDRKVVALTFDAGSGAQGVPAILAALDAAGVPGTFFLTGRWIEQYPDQALAIANSPADVIGNHSYDHPYFTQLDTARIDQQVRTTEDLIVSRLDRSPRPIFRFPYGDSDPACVAEVNRLGYGSIRWTVDTLGWKGASSGVSAGSIRQRVLDGLQPGEIVLMHVGAADDGTTLDADALPQVISDLKSRGYGFVDVWSFALGT